MSTMPGPGDAETWGPPTGHPNDPRTDDLYEEEEDPEFTEYEPDWEGIAEDIQAERDAAAMYRMDREY